jgi:hypothetical protein
MPTKTAVKKTVVKKIQHNGYDKLTDEQLGVLVAKHLRAHPEGAPTMAAAAIREFGKGVDGHRVRERLEAFRKPVAKKIAIKK